MILCDFRTFSDTVPGVLGLFLCPFAAILDGCTELRQGTRSETLQNKDTAFLQLLRQPDNVDWLSCCDKKL